MSNSRSLPLGWAATGYSHAPFYELQPLARGKVILKDSAEFAAVEGRRALRCADMLAALRAIIRKSGEVKRYDPGSAAAWRMRRGGSGK